MKRKILATCILIPFTTINVFSGLEAPVLDCSYAGKFQQCIQVQPNGRSIQDFICIDRAGEWQEVLAQIILDEKFKEIDNEIETYIEKLEQSKEEYFWSEASRSFLDAIDDIQDGFPKEWYYWRKYEQLCHGWILSELLKCVGKITNTQASEFLWGTTTVSCMTLMETKLSLYKQVSYDILKLNKIQVRKDERKQYVQQERTKYDRLLDMMRNIIGYMERILNWWPTRTGQTAGQ